HAKVLTTSNGLNIQIKQFPANCNHLQVWAGNKVMTIGLADKEIAAGTSALTFDFPLCVRGCRYDIELKYDCFDESTETGSWFTESISGIAGGGDIGVLNTSAAPPSVKVNLSNGRVYLSSDPTDYCNKSRINEYSSVILRFELRAKLKDGGQEVRAPDLNPVTYWNGTSQNEAAINAFLSDEGYNMDWNGVDMSQFNRARLDVFFVCKLNAYGDQEFFGKFSSPWYDVNVSGSGGGGGGDGLPSPGEKLSTYSGSEYTSTFLSQLTSASNGTTIKLENDVWLTTGGTFGASDKSITIDGDGKYGIVLAGSYEYSFEKITFKNGKGASTLGDVKRFGMIYWCGNGKVTFTNCNFTNNQTEGDIGGGAISLFGNSNTSGKGVNITNCNFTNNSGHAGAIDIGGSDHVFIIGCTFSESSDGHGNGDRDIYCGSSSENVSVSGSGNTSSDKTNPYQCSDPSKACPGLFD
ncbi:MAG: right-handed parallel beta-helix repeat-containing protein, partial [Treponema sp.]|nr:right-handed parallel beta-helix repeat-containing protein [Treponema sp.]